MILVSFSKNLETDWLLNSYLANHFISHKYVAILSSVIWSVNLNFEPDPLLTLLPSTLVISLYTYWCVYTYAGLPGRPALLKGHLPVSKFIYLSILSIYLSMKKSYNVPHMTQVPPLIRRHYFYLTSMYIWLVHLWNMHGHRRRNCRWCMMHAWCMAMHGMHGQERSQEQVDQNGVLQNF